MRRSLASILVVASALFCSIATAETPTVHVVTVQAPQPTDEPTYKDDNDFKSQVLNSTNLYRYEHNATAVAWNDSLAEYATKWTSSCKYGHSVTSSGENIAQGFQNLSLAVDAWGDERDQYDFNNQGYAEATGHFTQLVWKATRTMGCGRKFCGSTQGWYVSCNYWPAGNVILNGKFESTEVQKQVNNGQGFSYANASQGINSGDAGIGNYTAPPGGVTGGSGGGSGGGGGNGSGNGSGAGTMHSSMSAVFGMAIAVLAYLY